MKIRTSLIAAACALVALTASASGSAKVVTETKLTISRDVPLFHGRVKSTYDECLPDRKVTLFRKLSGPDHKLGVDHTNAEGKWKVHYTGAEIPGRKFYAKVRAKNVSSMGTGLSCSGDKSRTITFIGE